MGSAVLIGRGKNRGEAKTGGAEFFMANRPELVVYDADRLVAIWQAAAIPIKLSGNLPIWRTSPPWPRTQFQTRCFQTGPHPRRGRNCSTLNNVPLSQFLSIRWPVRSRLRIVVFLRLGCPVGVRIAATAFQDGDFRFVVSAGQGSDRHANQKHAERVAGCCL